MKIMYASKRFHARFAHIEVVHSGELRYRVFEGSHEVKRFGTLKGAQRHMKNAGYIELLTVDGKEVQSPW